MKRFFIFFIFIIIQFYLLDSLKIFNIKIDIFFPFLVNIALNYNVGWLIIFAYLVGFLKDLLSIYPLGVNIIGFLLSGYLLYKLSRKFIINLVYLKILIVLAMVFFVGIIKEFLLYLCGYPFNFAIFLKSNLNLGIWTSLLSFLLFRIIDTVL
ncbi:MAG: rod shape-determining protein MreD [Candidatus Omnitrophica bacterium]|nr:rod shape-determining protein MreD [Candidatus Omnitrophota bacterium]